MNEKEIIQNMSEEILRLQKELRKYKWTKENPWWIADSRFKAELFWERIDQKLECATSNASDILFPKVHFSTRNPNRKGKSIDKTLPLFTFVKRYAQKLLEEEE